MALDFVGEINKQDKLVLLYACKNKVRKLSLYLPINRQCHQMLFFDTYTYSVYCTVNARKKQHLRS